MSANRQVCKLFSFLVIFLTGSNLFLTGTGCKEHRETVPEKLPPLVRTLTIPTADKTEQRTFPVLLREGETARLSFRVPGQIQEFNVHVGQSLKTGDVIARLDPVDFELAIKRIESSLAEAHAGLRAMQNGARREDVATLESQLTAATSQWETAEKQFRRMENLKKDGTVSDVQYDLAKSTRDSALSAKESYQSQLEKAKKGSREEEIEMTQAKIAGLEVDLQLAQVALEHTVLKAPFDGIIAEKFSDNHEIVVPGIAVVSLVNPTTFEGELSVPEEIVLRKNEIQRIECVFDKISSDIFPATVKEMGVAAQNGKLAYPLTLNIELPANVNPENQQGVLSGMVGVAYIDLASPGSPQKIPTTAIFSDHNAESSGESFVFILNQDGTISKRPVKTGVFDEQGVQILDGLNPGDTIVSAGVRFLKDGQKVRTEDGSSSENSVPAENGAPAVPPNAVPETDNLPNISL